MWVLGIKGLRRIHCHYRSMQQSIMKVVPLFFGFNQMTAKSPKTFFFFNKTKNSKKKRLAPFFRHNVKTSIYKHKVVNTFEQN